jgi:hypothetical protein
MFMEALIEWQMFRYPFTVILRHQCFIVDSRAVRAMKTAALLRDLANWHCTPQNVRTFRHKGHFFVALENVAVQADSSLCFLLVPFQRIRLVLRGVEVRCSGMSYVLFGISTRHLFIYLFMCLCFNLLVTRCTNKFNIQQLYVLPTLYLCVV